MKNLIVTYDLVKKKQIIGLQYNVNDKNLTFDHAILEGDFFKLFQI